MTLYFWIARKPLQSSNAIVRLLARSCWLWARDNDLMPLQNLGFHRWRCWGAPLDDDALSAGGPLICALSLRRPQRRAAGGSPVHCAAADGGADDVASCLWGWDAAILSCADAAFVPSDFHGRGECWDLSGGVLVGARFVCQSLDH